MQTKILEKDAQLEELNKLLANKQLVISQLEQDIMKSRKELNEKEGRVNECLQVEVLLPNHFCSRQFIAVSTFNNYCRT